LRQTCRRAALSSIVADGAGAGRRYARAMAVEPISIPIAGAEPVSGLWQTPAEPMACLVLAHGAGAGMTHRAMTAIADGLSERGVATLRYQFPYMERGGKRVDPPPVAHAAVRAAVAVGAAPGWRPAAVRGRQVLRLAG